MPHQDLLASLVIFAVLLVAITPRLRSWWYRLPLPPGPKGLPIIGNLRQFPKQTPWLTYESWAKTYGPIMHLDYLRTHVIVLSSAKVALDLLEARSNIYSDRPAPFVLSELIGRKNSMFFMRYSDPRFKIYRRLLHSGLGPRSVIDFRSAQLHETVVLLQSLAKSPSEFIRHIRRNAAAVIMKIAYGYQVNSEDDFFIKVTEEGHRSAGAANHPRQFLFDSFPILQYRPQWVMGSEFEKIITAAKAGFDRIDNLPYLWTLKAMESEDHTESFVSIHLREPGKLIPGEHEDIVKRCSSALYAGGTDTTISALTTFFWLMTTHSEIQATAQREIDSITAGRLPNFDDQKHMPYVSALIKEVLRWGPVGPLGLQHRVMEDDIYEGYHIPAGSTIIANIWAITHDSEIYPDPHVFDPTRHLGEKAQPDPLNFVYGFGRRACPGAHFAGLSLFLNISSILATFNIRKAIDDSGAEIDPPLNRTTGMISHIAPFPCRIVPRSPEALMNL
ncbi:hypothetical protein AX16_007798 [Volvariella volvacea WC 439]|nr:hypothetical protein AX16_007798 [Volvariella volvacea WC 439]